MRKIVFKDVDSALNPIYKSIKERCGTSEYSIREPAQQYAYDQVWEAFDGQGNVASDRMRSIRRIGNESVFSTRQAH